MSIQPSSLLVVATALALGTGTVRAEQPAATAPTQPTPTQPAPTQAVATSPATAQPKTGLAEDLAQMPAWTVLVQASAYRIGASGKVRMPGTSALASPPGQSSLKLEKIGADSAQWAPYGRVTWRPNAGNWSFGISGFGTKIDETGTANEDQRIADMLIIAGDTITTDISYIEADLEAGYRIFETSRGRDSHGAARLAPYVDLTAGLRLLDTDVEFRHQSNSPALPAPGQQFQTSNHDVFVQPMVGVRAGLELVEKFNVDMKLSAGALPGNNRSFTFDMEPCFTWRPYKNFGVHIGYRNMFMNLRSGKDDARYSWRGTLAGIYFGITGRF